MRTGYLKCPLFFKKKEENKRKEGCLGVGENIPRRFLPAGGENLRLKFPGDLEGFWKSEDKGGWAGTLVNKRWKTDVR